jgi:hypothetical protein
LSVRNPDKRKPGRNSSSVNVNFKIIICLVSKLPGLLIIRATWQLIFKESKPI